ncbi:chitinase [Halpernia sp. GG3]
MKQLLILMAFGLSVNLSSQTMIPFQKPLKLTQNRSVKNTLKLYLNEKKWNEIFPNRFGVNKKNKEKTCVDFYSFKAFLAAASYFPEFLKGDPQTQKRELAAFLANIAQETSGGWAEAPGGYFKWGLYFLEEQQSGLQDDYTDFSKVNYPPTVGKKYFGRGPKQLSWNYNYGQFSEAWFGTKDTLLKNPELLSQDPVISFASAIWFWMMPQFPKPSCHEVITGKWIPSENDVQNGRLPGFGATVNVINGGVECGSGTDLEKTNYRYQYYNYFCTYFQVSAGDNLKCTNQKPFGR